MKVISIILVSVSLILSQQALSDVISPNTVTASSTFDSYSLPDLVNGSGITGGLDGGTHGEEYTDMWLSDGGDVTPWLVFDMGATQPVNAIHIWTYNAVCCGLERGVNSLDIYYSNNDIDYTFVDNVNLAQSGGGDIYAQVIPVSVNARYIRFNVLSNHGDELYTGLSEVAFNTGYGVAAPIPALSLWMTILLLLLITGIAALRFKRS